jgi:hypothetical protein
MGIDRDDRDERQARLQRMIDEFEAARLRRLLKARLRPADAKPDGYAETKAIVTAPAKG